jgi:hypothetical protein
VEQGKVLTQEFNQNHSMSMRGHRIKIVQIGKRKEDSRRQRRKIKNQQKKGWG